MASSAMLMGAVMLAPDWLTSILSVLDWRGQGMKQEGYML
jgi:hypothetical protein